MTIGSEITGISTSSTKLKKIFTFCLRLPLDLSGAQTFARNQDLPTLDDVAKVQEHNEREKDSYSNQDIDTTQHHDKIHNR